jgi:multidrug efflux pump subunit AcrA (membrane-fusion protein)
MRSMPRAAGLAAGLIAALSVAAVAQQGATPPASAQPTRPAGQTIVVGGVLDWLEKSDVSALRDGVIEQIEYQVGDRVEAGKPIGYLHRKLAELSVEKAKVAAESRGALMKAQAQRNLQRDKLAMLFNLIARNKANVSPEERKQQEAELAVAEAMEQEAKDNINLARAELDLAQQTLDEHTIYGPPFTGYVTDRMKGPAESVRASEPVLRIGRTDKLRFHGFIPLGSVSKLSVGDRIEFRVTIDEDDPPIERKRFTGKVKAWSREIPTVGRSEVQVLAEIENPENPEHPDLELLAGMKGELTIFLNTGKPEPVASRTAAPKPNAR